MTRRARALVLIGLTVLVAGGCGGEEEPSAVEAPERPAAEKKAAAEKPSRPLDAKTFRREVVKLCEASARELQEDTAGLPEPEAMFERIVATARRYQRKFEELTPPASLRKLNERSLAEGRLAIEIFERFLMDIRGGMELTAAYRRLMDALRPLIAISKETARRMGVPECARLPSEDARQA